MAYVQPKQSPFAASLRRACAVALKLYRPCLSTTLRLLALTPTTAEYCQTAAPLKPRRTASSREVRGALMTAQEDRAEVERVGLAPALLGSLRALKRRGDDDDGGGGIGESGWRLAKEVSCTRGVLFCSRSRC